jgi:hypothetical protein
MAGKIDPNGPVTRGMLDDAVDAILKGMENMFAERDQRFDNLEAKMDQSNSELKDEINGLKADLSDTPSHKEFGGL